MTAVCGRFASGPLSPSIKTALKKRGWGATSRPSPSTDNSSYGENEAYLSDFVKLAGILTLGSSGGGRRLVMRDCDDARGPRAEVSLATGRRRIGRSMGEQSETSASGAWSRLEEATGVKSQQPACRTQPGIAFHLCWTSRAFPFIFKGDEGLGGGACFHLTLSQAREAIPINYASGLPSGRVSCPKLWLWRATPRPSDTTGSQGSVFLFLILSPPVVKPAECSVFCEALPVCLSLSTLLFYYTEAMFIIQLNYIRFFQTHLCTPKTWHIMIV